MSALDTAKEIGRMAATATLSKDVVDLLKEKVTLLAEQITTLEHEKSVLQTENSDLKKKVADLEQQIDRLRPKGELHPDAVRFLTLLFHHGDLMVSQMAGFLGISKGMAEYHRDELLKAEMIGWPGVVTLGGETPVLLEPKGRAYLVEHGHV